MFVSSAMPIRPTTTRHEVAEERAERRSYDRRSAADGTADEREGDRRCGQAGDDRREHRAAEEEACGREGSEEHQSEGQRKDVQRRKRSEPLVALDRAQRGRPDQCSLRGPEQ